VNRALGVVALAAAALGCGSAALAQAPAPAAQAGRAAAHALPKRDTSLAGIDTSGGKVEYRREVFHYGGGSRDPFQTLITSSDVRPMITDLRLVSIAYDARYGRSVAIVRETQGDKIHRLRRGDVIGRLRVLQIKQYEVVFQIEEFGFERQVSLTLQRTAEANP
jgi:hypothetical protein